MDHEEEDVMRIVEQKEKETQKKIRKDMVVREKKLMDYEPKYDYRILPLFISLTRYRIATEGQKVAPTNDKIKKLENDVCATFLKYCYLFYF